MDFESCKISCYPKRPTKKVPLKLQELSRKLFLLKDICKILPKPVFPDVFHVRSTVNKVRTVELSKDTDEKTFNNRKNFYKKPTSDYCG